MPEVALFHELPRGSAALSPPESPAADGEQALVESLRQGQVSSFERLYERHGTRLKSVAMNMLRDASDAEDAVQETFLKLYRGLSGFKGESQISTWLYRILVNTCYDIGRRRKRRASVVGADDDQASRPEPAAPGVDPSLRLTLERTLEKLPDLQKTVFLLYEVEGLKHREIAEILEIPQGTSKYALFSAKRELQARILDDRARRRMS